MKNIIRKTLLLMFSISISNALGIGEVFDKGPGIIIKDTEFYAAQSNKIKTVFSKQYLNSKPGTINSRSHKTKAKLIA